MKPRKWKRGLFWIPVLFFFLLALLFHSFLGIVFGAPWVPTSRGIVRKMLSMADVQPGEVVYDLGSGDGRIIVMAAREFLATSVGIEINPLWVFWTRMKVALYRLSGKVNVVWGNFFGQDISKADVVTMYLLQGTNDKLKSKLEKELKTGTRVVSHVFTFDGWNPLKVDEESQINVYSMVDKNAAERRVHSIHDSKTFASHTSYIAD